LVEKEKNVVLLLNSHGKRPAPNFLILVLLRAMLHLTVVELSWKNTSAKFSDLGPITGHVAPYCC
jgi:hypothetical protein